MGELVPTTVGVPPTPVTHRPVRGLPVSLDDILRLAQVVAVGGMFGPYRNRPEAAATVMLQAVELGLSPLQGLTSIHLVENRPCLSAEMMRGLVLQAGHDITIVELTDQRCQLAGRRAGHTDPTVIAFTLADAQRAGVAGRSSWKAYPQAMLLARATTMLCRAAFPDVLLGVSYTPEELAGDAAGSGVEVIDVTATPASDGQLDRIVELQDELGLDDEALAAGIVNATAGRASTLAGLSSFDADVVAARMVARAGEVRP